MLCRTHYARVRATGSTADPPNRSEIIRKNWEERHYESVEAYLEANIKKGDDCWESTIRHNGQGYASGQFKGEIFLFHRKMYEIHKGDIPHDLIVRHTCDNKICCNPNHLVLGTKKDNRQDFMERHPRAKELIEELTEKGRKAVVGFWNSMNEEERADFVKRRAEAQAQIRAERIARENNCL